MVSGVDGGVAEAVMLGDVVASCSGGVVEGRCVFTNADTDRTG